MNVDQLQENPVYSRDKGDEEESADRDSVVENMCDEDVNRERVGVVDTNFQTIASMWLTIIVFKLKELSKMVLKTILLQIAVLDGRIENCHYKPKI